MFITGLAFRERQFLKGEKVKRAALERKRALNVWKKHFAQHVRQKQQAGGQSSIHCGCDLEVNRFRKGQKMFGCGRPRCYACHGDKLLGNKKHSVKKRELIYSWCGKS